MIGYSKTVQCWMSYSSYYSYFMLYLPAVLSLETIFYQCCDPTFFICSTQIDFPSTPCSLASSFSHSSINEFYLSTSPLSLFAAGWLFFLFKSLSQIVLMTLREILSIAFTTIRSFINDSTTNLHSLLLLLLYNASIVLPFLNDYDKQWQNLTHFFI
jgi:hypothetical protein